MAALEAGRDAAVAPAAAGSTPVAAADGPTAEARAMVDLLRDITRGGLAGLVVGIVVAGIGGRIVMRLAALLVPDATGAITENGNVVGAITPGGTVALVVFVGLFAGVFAGSIWVTIQPWLPARPMVRIALTVPIALGLGINGLIEDRNPDFAVLGHDPAVVAALVILVALFGPSLVLADGWLDARLPHPAPGGNRVAASYASVAAIGVLLTGTLVVPQLVGSDLALSGLALIVVGICTLASWSRRLRGQRHDPAPLTAVARIGLTVATVAGLSVAAREIVGALGAG